MADVSIREGFLCPICMQDLGTVADLQKHFDDSHTGEDKDVINQLKGLFGKAKRKLLKKDKEGDDVFSAFSGEGTAPVSELGTTNAGGIDPTMWEPQELGASRSYTDGFKRVRDARIDRFVVETNKLLIRLDKLISPDAPADPNKRKVYDKAVVPWAPDKDVNLCTSCGKSFTLTRRRHHCRLCGGIICKGCSQFLNYSYATKLTNPAFQYEGEGFRRSSSSTSLNSILSPEGEGHIRTCEQCRVLLERRDQQMEQRNSKPFIVQLYQKMKHYIEESDQVLPTYLNMAESLRAGETMYNLQEANIYRNRLAKLYENIDLLSKRIYTLGTNDAEPPTPTTLRLQKMVRSYASSYLQRSLWGLQALPTEEDLTKLRERKRLEAERRIEEERRLAAERDRSRRDKTEVEKKPPRSPEKTVNGTRQAEIQSQQGWKPQEIKTGNSDDPMIQQMNIIKGYAKQARQAGKWDEVQMLEENLKELQREYWAQQEKHRQSQNNVKDTHKQDTEPYNPFYEDDKANAVGEQRGNFAPRSPARSLQQRTSPSKVQMSPAKVRTSPSKTKPSPTKSIPSQGSPAKTNSTNPFEETTAKHGSEKSFDDDATNPFSDNYKDKPSDNSYNPFS